MQLNQEQERAYMALESGGNIFLTGRAGTGKTAVLKKFISAHKDEVIVCAPTGIAAHLVGGVTLHRLFGIPSSPCPKAGRKHVAVLEGCRTVIIDEISMVRRDVFAYAIQIILNMEKKLNRHIQVVVCGEFFQIPPVVPKKDAEIMREYYGNDFGIYAFQSHEWKQLQFQTIILNTIVRQNDLAFLERLDCVRQGNLAVAYELAEEASQHVFDPNRITICTTNAAATLFNEEKLKEIDAPEHFFKIEVNGDVKSEEVICEETLVVKEGCRVMLIANISNKRMNGMMGKIISIQHNPFTCRDEITVAWDSGGSSVVTQYTWTVYKYITVETCGKKRVEREACGTMTQMPLKLGYAITVHKSQGQTYEGANLILDNVFACGQLYTAFSRVRDFEKMHVSRISIKALTDPIVAEFYNSLLIEQVLTANSEPQIKRERRGRKSTWRGEKTVLIRVPACLAERLKDEAHRILEREVVHRTDGN